MFTEAEQTRGGKKAN